MSGAIPPLCLYAFMSWTGMTLPIVLWSYPLGKFDMTKKEVSCRELLKNFNTAPIVGEYLCSLLSLQTILKTSKQIQKYTDSINM